MTLATTGLLAEKGIRTAIVVDDAYDLMPRAEDLSFDRDEWENFLDDLTDEDEATLREIYPGYSPEEERELFNNDMFIACLWNDRDRFRPELVRPIFHTYINDSTHDLRIVETVERQLETLGLSTRTAGRSFVDSAIAADLIVIDLFLGAQQSELDFQTSVRGLAQVISRRVDEPPVIILMSRSGQLTDKADPFREDAGVFASGFRTVRKSDLEKPDRLEHIVRDLARHRTDSLKLNDFLQRWTAGLSDAASRTQTDIRRLDLEDWAQIRDLLLTAEVSSAGRYVLEVLELAFLHELESDEHIVAAAAALDTLERETYPPTTTAASKDTLGLVAKTLFEHPNCLHLDVEAVAPVTFGDIIGPVDGVEFPNNPTVASLTNAVLLAMTPECDLQRGDATRILFMVGETRAIDAPAAGQSMGSLHTPILELKDDRRVCVDWQPNHLLTLTYDEVRDFLSTAGTSASRVARLRTANAVALQQQLLSNLGRVGLLAPMPTTFPIKVAVHYPSVHDELVHLPIDGEETIDGVCYVGRGTDHKEAAAPFDSIHRFGFLEALETISEDQVSRHSRSAVSNLRRVEILDLLFSRGLRFNPKKRDPQPLKEPVDGIDVTLANVVLRGPAVQAFGKPSQIRNAGLVFELRGLPV